MSTVYRCAACLFVVWIAACGRQAPPEPVSPIDTAARAQGPPAAGREVELVAYRDDFGLVNERRAVSLPDDGALVLDEVSRELDPDSLLVRFDGEQAPALLSCAWNPGIVTRTLGLREHVGRPVEVVRYDRDQHEVGRDTGRLAAVEADGTPVVELDGKLVLDPPGTVVLSGSSAGGAGDVTVQADRGGQAVLDLSYLTRGLSWSPTYTAIMADQESDRVRLMLDGMVTNRTGAEFPRAGLVLMVGHPSRAARSAMNRYAGAARAALPSPLARNEAYRVDLEERELDQFAVAGGATTLQSLNSLAVEGVHYGYRVPNRATFAPGRMTRVPVLDCPEVVAKLDFSVDGGPLSKQVGKGKRRLPVALGLAIQNSQAGGLGIPLPGGALRLYATNDRDALRYLGADTLGDLAVDDWMRLTVADAFGLTADVEIVDNQPLGGGKQRVTVSVRLGNQRGVATPVRYVQRLAGASHAMHESSHSYAKLPDGRLEWRVEVPAGGEATLRFAVDLR